MEYRDENQDKYVNELQDKYCTCLGQVSVTDILMMVILGTPVIKELYEQNPAALLIEKQRKRRALLIETFERLGALAFMHLNECPDADEILRATLTPSEYSQVIVARKFHERRN